MKRTAKIYTYSSALSREEVRLHTEDRVNELSLPFLSTSHSLENSHHITIQANAGWATAPSAPFLTSPSGRVKTVTGVLTERFLLCQTDRHSGAAAHYRLRLSDWLPRYTNAHSYTNTHMAPQPPVYWDWDPDHIAQEVHLKSNFEVLSWRLCR